MIPFLPVIGSFALKRPWVSAGIGAAALLAVVFGVRWYANQQYLEGARDAKSGILERLGAESEEQLQRQLSRVEDQQEQLDEAYRELADSQIEISEQREQLRSERRALLADHRQSLETFRRSLANVSTDVSRIADSDLVDEWDAALADLRRFDSHQGDGVPPPGSPGTEAAPSGH